MTKRLFFFATFAVFVAISIPSTSFAVAGDGASSNIRLLDTNTNGKIDRITFDIANPNGETWALVGILPYGLSVNNDGLFPADVTISSVTIVGSATANPVVVRVDLSEADEDLNINTSASAVELIYTQQTGNAACTQCLQDGTDEELNNIAVGDAAGVVNTETDFASPILLTGSLYPISGVTDQDGNGQIDRAAILFSETVDAATVQTADFSLSAPYVLTGSPTIASGLVTINVTEISTPDTNATPTVTVGTGVADTASPANSTVGHSVVLNDITGPVLVSHSPTSGGTLANTLANITLTFSEPLNTGLATYVSFSPSLGTLSYQFSNSNKTVTVAHTGISPGSITATVPSTVADTTGNTYNNTASSNTFSFLSPSASSSSTTTTSSTVPVTTTSVTVTSPNGGETWAGGETHTIMWTSVGSINNVNLSYSKDGGVTYLPIVSGTSNSGSYVWHTPAAATTSARVRVVGRDSGGATLATDDSNASFTITSPSVTAPASPVAFSARVRNAHGAEVVLIPGNLFRSISSPAVYLVNTSGTRSVFPNEATFFSYGYTFAQVTMIADNELAQFSLGRRVTIKPGAVLIKLPSESAVYEIGEGAVLHQLPTEASAVARHGANWAQQVRDVSPVFFVDYTRGTAVSS